MTASRAAAWTLLVYSECDCVTIAPSLADADQGTVCAAARVISHLAFALHENSGFYGSSVAGSAMDCRQMRELRA